MSLENRLLAEILAANRLEERGDGWRDRNTGLVLRCTYSFGLGEASRMASGAGWVPVCVGKCGLWFVGLQPADAPEPPEQACAYQQYRADYAKIAVFPIEFRHVLEVHPVDARDRRRDRDDGEP